ncbi:MAG: hypothetical protein ABTQ34_00800 [Bdellovibrionales bacterium]
MKKNKPVFALLALIALIVLGAAGWKFLTTPDDRTTGQKIDAAIDALPQGLDRAIDQLEDRTPGQRLGDAIKDVGEGIKRKSSGQ